MLNYRLLQQLAPLNFRDESKTEALPDYLARVAPLVPFIPDNVLSQWIYRHWRGFESTGALSISPATSSSVKAGPPPGSSSRPAPAIWRWSNAGARC